MDIPGLIYLPQFISPDQETELLAEIDSQPWRNDLKRRVQHYGYRYDYTKRTVDSSMYLGDIPEFLIPLRNQIATYFDKDPDQAIINEYEPGQGISKHVDCVPCFGPVVASISLGSPCVMEFWTNTELKELWFENRGLLVLSQDARFKWAHSIPARKDDYRNETSIPRSRRVSVTFRTVRLNERSKVSSS